MRPELTLAFCLTLVSCGSCSTSDEVTGPISFEGASWFNFLKTSAGADDPSWMNVNTADVNICGTVWPRTYRDAEVHLRDPIGSPIRAGLYSVPGSGTGFRTSFLPRASRPTRGRFSGNGWQSTERSV